MQDEIYYFPLLDSDDNIKDMYTPAITGSTEDSKQCVLYNKKGQGNYALCWAASVATICNYKKGSNITAKQVADKMNVGYNEGANVFVARQALDKYGVVYNKLNCNPADCMSWSKLKKNIKTKWPVYVSAKAPKGGHAVVAYGYTVGAGTAYVVMWNPGEKAGSGKTISAAFNGSGTSFSYKNTTYVWTYSVSKY